jgi:hypothetical protein
MKDNDETKSEPVDEETTGESADKDTADIVEDPEGPTEGLLVSVSRGVGSVARSVSDGIQSVSDALAPRRFRRERPPADDLEFLLIRLGELVSAHEETGYPALGDKEDFWRLIAKLSGFQRQKRLKRTPSGVPRRTVRRHRASAEPTAAADMAEAAPAPPDREKPDKKSGKKSDEKSDE